MLALTLAAASIVSPAGLKSVFDPAAHGFTGTLYAWTAVVNTNGSTFAGFGLTSSSASLGTVAMLLGRYLPLLAALALAGAVASKRTVPVSAGTFRAEGPTFSVLLVGVIVLTAGLMIMPALTLGPIVEALMH